MASGLDCWKLIVAQSFVGRFDSCLMSYVIIEILFINLAVLTVIFVFKKCSRYSRCDTLNYKRD